MLKSALSDLARSGITAEEADEAGMYAVRDARAALGDAFQPLPALVIPYPDPLAGDLLQYADDAGDPADFFRLRYLEKPAATRRGWQESKFQRYAQPPRSGVHPYFPHLEDLDWGAVLADPREPLLITEGEKKALRVCLGGWNCIGLGGVYNFLASHELLPILERISWTRRKVYICYDSDSAANTDIQAAEARLAGELVKRGAQVRICRLPEQDNGEKVGVDDFLEEQGEAAFQNVLAVADEEGRVGRVQQAVLRMNESCAWIESFGAVLDLTKNELIRKDDFVKGSAFSSETVTVPAPRGQDGVKHVQVAPKFLVSPLARRYDDSVCDPSTTEPEIRRDGKLVYNTFRGLAASPGDVSDWITLTLHLFDELDDPWFPIKFFAYKAQNPNEKIPLAFVLVGSHQGTGKSLWGKMLELAFSPYSSSMSAKNLLSDFTGWLHNKMVILFDEADPKHVARGSEHLKNYISERKFFLNEKYIKGRQADNLATFILTSNNLATAVFEADDRRMVIASPPDPHVRPISDPGVYTRLYTEYDKGADASSYGAHLMDYLLNYDLKDWVPPSRAPMTEDKRIAFEDSLGPVELVAHKITQGLYRTDPVIDWADSAMLWAQESMEAKDPVLRHQAGVILDTLPSLAVRPWYTAEELLRLLPHLLEDAAMRTTRSTAAGELSRRMRQSGVPYVRLKDKRRPTWRGEEQTFLIVSKHPEHRAPMTQEDFDRAMRNAPRYRDVIRSRKAEKS